MLNIRLRILVYSTLGHLFSTHSVKEEGGQRGWQKVGTAIPVYILQVISTVFLLYMKHFFPQIVFLASHTVRKSKAVSPKQVSSFTLAQVFCFDSFQGKILVNNMNSGWVPDPYAVQTKARTGQNIWPKSSCFLSVAADGGRTNKETKHTLGKKRYLYIQFL